MKKFLIKNKEVIRILAILPITVFVSLIPGVSAILGIITLSIQLICFGLMFYIGWNY